MTYQQTIEFLYSQLPMFSRMGSAAYNKNLSNTLRLCEALGNPQHRFKSIHVAGTNGKGSVSHMMAAILQTNGYKTGLYTSPHLYDFRERIKINGALADKDYIVGFVHRLKPLIETVQPSFFELTVAMAFEYFAVNEVDVAVIEVGLGGRLDSTNVIHPELCIITNIGWDHMNLLGNSLPEIAREKAGIIKKNIPVVIGERQPEVAPVFDEQAGLVQAPLSYASDHFKVSNHRWSHSHLILDVINDKNESERYELDLPGIYQAKNLCTVLQAIDALTKHTGIIIKPDSIPAALYKTKALTGLMGRWEIIREKPIVVLEVAHNKEGIEQMLLHLEELQYKQLHIVFGMVKDKEPGKVISLLPQEAVYYFTQAQIPRALDAVILKEKAAAFNLNGDTFPDVNTALSNALSNATAEDIILVCGSIFLVAEVERS
jgi:dihydrofolate synthase/folylpolyglutamate synthase